MICIACNGTGDGSKHGEKACMLCDGTGHVCDICGESCETGMDLCINCDNEQEDK
jgi:hypothetical protein